MNAKTPFSKRLGGLVIILGLLVGSVFALAGPVSSSFAVTTDGGGGGGGGGGKAPKPLSLQPKTSECKSGADCCNGVKTSFSFNCQNGSGEIQSNPIFGLLLAILNFLAIGVGIAVTIGVILGGYKFMMSNGNASMVEEGKKTIANSIIALVLFALMYALINFLVPGGVFR